VTYPWFTQSPWQAVPLGKDGTRKERILSTVERAAKHSIPAFIKDALYRLYPGKLKRRNWPHK